MGTIKSYRDLIVWQRSFQFALDIINFTKTFPGEPSSSIITRQLIRSATSVGANITEGSAAKPGKEFTQFFRIAKKLAVETEYWLCLVQAQAYGKRDEINRLLQECNEIIRMLSTIVYKTSH